MRNKGGNIAAAIAVVAIYTSVPVLASTPAIVPEGFRTPLLGVPLSAWYIGALMILFPLVTWLLTLGDLSGEGE